MRVWPDCKRGGPGRAHRDIRGESRPLTVTRDEMPPCVGDRASPGVAPPVFDPGEGLFDRVEVGRVGRQEPEMCRAPLSCVMKCHVLSWSVANSGPGLPARFRQTGLYSKKIHRTRNIVRYSRPGVSGAPVSGARVSGAASGGARSVIHLMFFSGGTRPARQFFRPHLRERRGNRERGRRPALNAAVRAPVRAPVRAAVRNAGLRLQRRRPIFRAPGRCRRAGAIRGAA